MFSISKEIQFDAGHRVPLHESKCKNPHGHRYRVVAHVEGVLITEGPESGMVRDFSIVKQLLTEKVHDVFDHGFIVHEHDNLAVLLGEVNEPEAENVYGVPVNHAMDEENRYGWKVIVVPFYPTAECLAKYIYDTLKPDLPGLMSLDVWETPTSKATYFDEMFGFEMQEEE